MLVMHWSWVMSLHIKKIMDNMLIFTLLKQCLTEKDAENLYKQKKLLFKGYNSVLLDLTNVCDLESGSIEKLYEVHKLLVASGGNIKIFGVTPNIADAVFNSSLGNSLSLQLNEVIDTDYLDIPFREICLAS